MKNFKKVLRNVSEAVFERFFVIPNYGDVREDMFFLYPKTASLGQTNLKSSYICIR